MFLVPLLNIYTALIMVNYFVSSVLYTSTVYFCLLLWLVNSFTPFRIRVHQQQIIHFHSAGY